MALTTKRIINLPTQNDPQEGDYLAIDNGTNGTHKIPVGRIGVELDDTLTEAGKAADAKATGDALDEIRSQIEVTGTASGAIATFTDGANAPMKSCMVSIVPKQIGSGTPSPDNVRQISGWESVNLYDTGVNVWDEEWEQGDLNSTTGEEISSTTYIRSVNYAPCVPNAEYYGKANSKIWLYWYDKDKNFVSNTSGGFQNASRTAPATAYFFRLVQMASTYDNGTSINYPSTDTEYHAYNPNSATTTTPLGRTVYGGTLDVVTGVLTAYPFYPSYNGETLNGRWVCDRAVYAEGTTPPTGSQVALISGTGTIYTLTPTEVSTLLGENNVWADSGDVGVVYVRDLNIAINNLLNSNGTRSLGMMAMSAPTETTVEEPTEDEAEDDMR